MTGKLQKNTEALIRSVSGKKPAAGLLQDIALVLRNRSSVRKKPRVTAAELRLHLYIHRNPQGFASRVQELVYECKLPLDDGLYLLELYDTAVTAAARIKLLQSIRPRHHAGRAAYEEAAAWVRRHADNPLVPVPAATPAPTPVTHPPHVLQCLGRELPKRTLLKRKKKPDG
jgi:hypothetical protein